MWRATWLHVQDTGVSSDEGRCIELVAECSEKWAKINANLGAVDGIIRDANLQVCRSPKAAWSLLRQPLTEALPSLAAL